MPNVWKTNILNTTYVLQFSAIYNVAAVLRRTTVSLPAVGAAAVDAIMEGQRNVMIGIDHDEVVYVPFTKPSRTTYQKDLVNVLRALSIWQRPVNIMQKAQIYSRLYNYFSTILSLYCLSCICTWSVNFRKAVSDGNLHSGAVRFRILIQQMTAVAAPFPGVRMKDGKNIRQRVEPHVHRYDIGGSNAGQPH